MKMNQKGPVRQTIAGWGQRLKGLLAAEQGECRYCRNAYRDGEIYAQGFHLKGLCRSCSESIPWIREIVCGVCGRYEACPDCLRRAGSDFARNRSAVRYNDQMKVWLARYKYRGDERLSELLADILMHAYHLHQEADQAASVQKGTVLLTFVPLSDVRRFDRGFNQAEQLARALGRRVGLPVAALLRRNRHTEKQSLKSRGERVKDMRDLFALHEEGIQTLGRLSQRNLGVPPRIYIIDDVYTTGSTLGACAKAIRQGIDAPVYGLTLAR